MLGVRVEDGVMNVSPFVAAKKSSLVMHELPAWAQIQEVLAYARYSAAYLCNVYNAKTEIERAQVVQGALSWYYSKRVR